MPQSAVVPVGPPASVRTHRLRQSAAVLGLAVALGGFLSLLGWFLPFPRLSDWWGTGITIKINTSLCFLAAGGALSLLALRPKRNAAVHVLAAFVAVVGGVTLIEHLGGWNFGIDTLLADEPPGERATAAPGRMGPPASISFVLVGYALIVMTVPRLRQRGALASCVALAISMLSLTGYLYDAEFMYAAPNVTGIAMQTAVMLFILALGLLVSVPEHPPLSLFIEHSAAGMLARRLLPFVILVPIALGWLRIQGEEAHYYDAAFGAAIRTVVEVALLGGLLWGGLLRLSVHEKLVGDGERRVNQDIARRKEVEAALRAKERQLTHVTDNAAVIVAQCDLDRRFTFINRTGAEFLGLRIEDVVGRQVADVVGEEAYRSLAPYMERVLGGEHVVFESEIPYAGTGPRWMRGVYVPDRDDRGRVCGWIAAISDITERKRAEEALLVADRRKDEFLAMLAHELRNPLAPVLSSLDFLGRVTHADPRTEELLGIMRRQMAHMVRLVDDLLDVGRISSSKISLRRQRVELAPLIRDAVESVRPLADEMGQHLRIETPDEPLLLDADAARLSQVFGNLLNNACRYTARGGDIVISARREEGEAEISVKDNGIGIPLDCLDDIFQMFSQVDRSLERTAGGLGIGLHLVRELVGMHGGRAWARSQGLGHGSEFLVRLPLTTPAEGAPSPRAPSVNAPSPRAPSVNAPARRILIVDDNVDAARTLAMLLELGGHQCETVFDGLTALTRTGEFEPEVVLLDIGLPGMNGYDVCRELRRRGGGLRFIVALTGWGQNEDRRKSREAGFDAHLVKPVDHAVLGELLASMEGVPASEKAPDLQR